MLSTHAAWFTQRFGETKPEYFPIPFAKPKPNDPTRPITDLSGSWSALRERAGVKCRLHDLRHTAATKMCEAGVPDSTMLTLMGHMSRAMPERYSPHTAAVESLSFKPRTDNSDGVPTKSSTVERLGPIQ